MVIRGTAAITAVLRIIPMHMQLRTTIPITPIRMRTGRLRNSNSMVRNSSTALRSTGLRSTVLRNSHSMVLRHTVLRNSSRTVLRSSSTAPRRTLLRRMPGRNNSHLRRLRSKPRHSRTRLLPRRQRLRSPATTTPPRMASGNALAKPVPSSGKTSVRLRISPGTLHV